MKFRDYQKDIIDRGTNVVRKHRFLYLSMEVRTGKTLTSLGIADNVHTHHLLFVTKKRAISSIEDDYKMLNPSYEITVINYESLHKLNPSDKYDFIVLDEAHSMGAFPKPSKRAKQVREIISLHNPYVILLSGTPTPESYSQMYHQVYGIPNNPFAKYKNFYRFADDYVRVTTRRINGFMTNDYSKGRDSIIQQMQPYTISYSQKEAGFKSSIEEEIMRVRMNPITYSMCNTLKKTFVLEGSDEVVLADTQVKLMQKLHQMYSGTVKFESGNSMVFDKSKAEFIYSTFDGKKIGIFYKFKQELNAIKEVFGDDVVTELDDFNSTDCKAIALQIVSGREGISLRNADYIVYYNIDFSATSYWQSRDRMTTKERAHNKVYWIFSENGIEDKIYKAVCKKKDYTIRHFERDLLSL